MPQSQIDTKLINNISESELVGRIQQDFNDRIKIKCKPEQAQRADKSSEELREAIVN